MTPWETTSSLFLPLFVPCPHVGVLSFPRNIPRARVQFPMVGIFHPWNRKQLGRKGGRREGVREGRKRRTSQRSFEIILNVRYGNEIRHGRRFGQNIHCYRGKFIRWIYFEWKMDVLLREREGIVVLFLLQAQSFTPCFTMLLASSMFEVMPDVWIWDIILSCFSIFFFPFSFSSFSSLAKSIRKTVGQQM